LHNVGDLKLLTGTVHIYISIRDPITLSLAAHVCAG